MNSLCDKLLFLFVLCSWKGLIQAFTPLKWANRISVSKTSGKEDRPAVPRRSDGFDELLDFKYLKKTIDAWQRPLPLEYLSQPLVIAGPSGVGKARLAKQLLKDYAKFFRKVVTHTTRSPRNDEQEGVDYHFVDVPTFEAMVARGDFVEHACVHGNRYGVSVAAWQNVTAMNKISILEVDVQGIQRIKEVSKEKQLSPRILFIQPPGGETEMLRLRLLERGTEATEDIELRLRNAEVEIKRANEPGFVDFIITNDDLGTASNTLFRRVRDWYPALPSAAKIRYLMRQWKRVKEDRLAKQEDGSALH
jgi:guanylate kinase